MAAIEAPLLIHYAELDERVNSGWPEFEAALVANGKAFEAHFYPGANHGFHNDTTPRYDPEAAELAWSRTLAFFERHLDSAACARRRPGAQPWASARRGAAGFIRHSARFSAPAIVTHNT